MNTGEVRDRFIEVYGDGIGDIRLFNAPGRVNLIGEHTDYNGGYVFPCALSFGTYAAVRKRADDVIRFASISFDNRAEITAAGIRYERDHGWANYPKGVLKIFQDEGCKIGGFDVLYCGDIPNSAGLSSSASIELVTAAAVNNLFELGMDMISMVKLCQRAENRFMGVNCGIMDQFSIGMGKRGYALLLDCGSMEYKYVPLDLGECSLVIANTNKKRGLADSKYNERRDECERAVEYIKKELDISFLCSMDVPTFEKYRHLIKDSICEKRAAHAVYENARVLEAVDRLSAGDLKGFGILMNESHISLRDMYEVTGFELDTLVEAAWEIDGVLGSRMTGAGFGGCTVSIVRKDSVEEFVNRAGEKYKKMTGLEADFYIAETGDGACEVGQ